MIAAGVAHADCQALLGHKHGDITNLHSTDRKLKELKAHIDRVDYHLEVAGSSQTCEPLLARHALRRDPIGAGAPTRDFRHHPPQSR